MGWSSPRGPRGDGGASWLGVALLDEALALRTAGDAGPLLSWLAVPGERYDAAIAADVELTAYGAEQLRRDRGGGDRPACRRGPAQGRHRTVPRRCDLRRLATLSSRRRPRLERRPATIEVTGVWSHLACVGRARAPVEQDASSRRSTMPSRSRRRRGAPASTRPPGELRRRAHHPDTWYTMVRPGIAIYGLSPLPAASPVPLRPAMTAARLARAGQAACLPARASPTGTRTSPSGRRRVGLVPLGYGDGIPRHASNAAPVAIAGAPSRSPAGSAWTSSCVDLGDATASPGDEVVVFGDGPRRPDGVGLGRRGRHHQLRDRDAGRRAGAATVRLHAGPAGEPSAPCRRPAAWPRWAWSRPARRPASQPNAASSVAASRRRAATPFGSLRGDARRSCRRRRSSCMPRWMRRPAPHRGGPPGRLARRSSSSTGLRSTSTAGTSSARRSAGSHRLVFYDQRSHGAPAGQAEHATIDQLGATSQRPRRLVAPTAVVLVGHSMGGMTLLALAEQHPELFGDRVVGVGSDLHQRRRPQRRDARPARVAGRVAAPDDAGACASSRVHPVSGRPGASRAATSASPRPASWRSRTDRARGAGQLHRRDALSDPVRGGGATSTRVSTTMTSSPP